MQSFLPDPEQVAHVGWHGPQCASTSSYTSDAPPCVTRTSRRRGLRIDTRCLPKGNTRSLRKRSREQRAVLLCRSLSETTKHHRTNFEPRTWKSVQASSTVNWTGTPLPTGRHAPPAKAISRAASGAFAVTATWAVYLIYDYRFEQRGRKDVIRSGWLSSRKG